MNRHKKNKQKMNRDKKTKQQMMERKKDETEDPVITPGPTQSDCARQTRKSKKINKCKDDVAVESRTANQQIVMEGKDKSSDFLNPGDFQSKASGSATDIKSDEYYQSEANLSKTCSSLEQLTIETRKEHSVPSFKTLKGSFSDFGKEPCRSSKEIQTEGGISSDFSSANYDRKEIQDQNDAHSDSGQQWNKPKKEGRSVTFSERPKIESQEHIKKEDCAVAGPSHSSVDQPRKKIKESPEKYSANSDSQQIPSEPKKKGKTVARSERPKIESKENIKDEELAVTGPSHSNVGQPRRKIKESAEKYSENSDSQEIQFEPKKEGRSVARSERPKIESKENIKDEELAVAAPSHSSVGQPRRKIIEAAEKYPKCNRCERKFRTNEKLKLHMSQRKHMKYWCDPCEKIFCRKRTYEKHKCAFSQKKTHLPLLCPICRETFLQRKLFDLHLANDHALRKFVQCQNCMATFLDFADYLQHVQDMH